MTESVYQEWAAGSSNVQRQALGSLGDVDVEKRHTFAIAAFGVVNANKQTAIETLLNTQLVAAIDAFIAAVAPGLGINTSTHTVQYNAQVSKITRGANGLTNDALLDAGSDSFQVTLALQVHNS